MSNIPFNHLKLISKPIPEPKKSIWHFFKSQLGLFGEPQKTQTKPANRIPFASQKEKEEHNVGDLKSENNKQYIFLETTIGKPRWHSHEELTQMAKEGKKIPEIAKKKMPALAKEEEEGRDKKFKKESGMTHAEYEKEKEMMNKRWSRAVQDKDPTTGKPKMSGMNQKETQEYFSKLQEEIKNEEKPESPEPKQTELVKPESNVSKKSTPIEKYVQGKIREGNNEPAISRQQEIRKNEATEKQKEQQEELTKLLQRKAQLQREIGSELEASKKVNKGGQEYKVDTKDVARQEMKQLDKKIGNLKQALGKLGENVFEQAQNEDMFSQSPAKPKTSSSGITVKFKISPEFAQTIAEAKAGKAKEKNKQYAIEQLEKEIKYFESWRGKEDIDEEKVETAIAERKKELSALQDKDQLSENINKKIVEQGEKEKPTLKQLMTTQAEVLKLAEIPEEDIAMYALNSMADGAKLRSYSTEVMKGEMTAEQAAEKVKGDYTKMKEGLKPTNAGELPSEEKKTQPEASKEQKEPWQTPLEEIKAKFPNPSGEEFRKPWMMPVEYWAGFEAQALSHEEPENVKPPSQRAKEWHKGRVATALKEGEPVPAEVLKAYPDLEKEYKDTLPLLPSEKDVKEGDTKQINGVTYELKRGESGELRWHRVTEEEKGVNKKKYIAKYSMPNGDVKQTESYDTPGMAAANVEKNAVRYRVESVEPKEEEKSKKTFTVSFIRKENGAPQEYQEVKAKSKNEANKIGQQIAKENDWRFLDVAEGNKEENLKGTVTPEDALGEKQSITMPKQEAIDEHKNLVKVLETGTEEERKAEAAKQAKELEGYEEGMDEGTPEDAPERSLKELVEERLNEKQENKKFKDVGNRVGGSKKEIAAIKVLTMDDLSKMDNATAYKVVTKDRILADIDPTAEKAAGVESGAAYLKKKLREALMARPLNSQEARKKYLELIPKIFDKIDSCKTVEELSNLGSDYFDIWRSFRGKGVRIHFKGDEKNDLIDVLGKEFANLIGRNSDSAKEHWVNAKFMSPVSQEESDKHYKQYEEAQKNAYKINKDRMDAYTPEQWENYFKNDPMVTYSFTRRQLADQKKNEPEKYQEAIEKYKAQDYKNNEIRNEVLPYLKWTAQSPSYATREESWKWAEPKTEEKKVIQKAKDELKIHDNPPLAFIKRTNGREVKNSDVSAEALTKKYGFKSVQLGNYVKDAEAKEHIRHFVESMNDLEDALGIDIKKMNELSGLSIAFGARGGGRSSAHYEPMSKIINLTKSMADGAVAHEFFHCIDHLLGGMREGTRTENIFLSQTPDANKGKLGEAMKGVMDAIRKGNNTITKSFQPNEQKYTYASIRRTFEQKGFEFTKNDIMKYVKDGRDLGQAEDYFKYLATLSGKPIEVDFETRRSKFYDGALSFKSDYWKRPLEMFARAAESYIQDKIMSKDMYNNYLVGGNNIQQPDRKWENTEYLNMAYPQGEERVRINEAFDKLIEAAKEELGIGVEKPKEGKRISSEVQMQKSLYNPSFFETYFRRTR